MAEINEVIKGIFTEIADRLESGSFHEGITVGITLLGSEVSEDNLFLGATDFARKHPTVDVVCIGPKRECELKNVRFSEVTTEDEQHKRMEELLDKKEIQACVTQHYNFPIGVSTVGRVVTPGFGKEMTLATTTGTSSTHRVEAMVKNAVAGIITAKAMGVNEPTVGILNVDGARRVEQALEKLKSNGYDLNFSSSSRKDGGAVMRGNDLLQGSPDVMVTDSLSGNLLMKVFSSYTTGGSYESLGYGYGPGIGEGYERLILILSRVSGRPVIQNALSYAVTLVKNQVLTIAKEEYQKANRAGFQNILQELKEADQPKAQEAVKEPPKEVVTASIAGIDIMQLEDAVHVLWKHDIYAQSGMGCTGPIVLVSETKLELAKSTLQKEGYLAEERAIC